MAMGGVKNEVCRLSAISIAKKYGLTPKNSTSGKNIGTKIIGNMAIAMGNYFFTAVDGGDIVKVEYSFGYTTNSDGQLKIILHGSHIPYSP